MTINTISFRFTNSVLAVSVWCLKPWKYETRIIYWFIGAKCVDSAIWRM